MTEAGLSVAVGEAGAVFVLVLAGVLDEVFTDEVFPDAEVVAGGAGRRETVVETDYWIFLGVVYVVLLISCIREITFSVIHILQISFSFFNLSRITCIHVYQIIDWAVI